MLKENDVYYQKFKLPIHNIGIGRHEKYIKKHFIHIFIEVKKCMFYLLKTIGIYVYNNNSIIRIFWNTKYLNISTMKHLNVLITLLESLVYFFAFLRNQNFIYISVIKTH